MCVPIEGDTTYRWNHAYSGKAQAMGDTEMNALLERSTAQEATASVIAMFPKVDMLSWNLEIAGWSSRAHCMQATPCGKLAEIGS